MGTGQGSRGRSGIHWDRTGIPGNGRDPWGQDRDPGECQGSIGTGQGSRGMVGIHGGRTWIPGKSRNTLGQDRDPGEE